MSVIKKLELEHITFADTLARRRDDAAIAKGRPPHNGAPIDDSRHAIERLGVRCECAGYLWAKPVKWHTFEEIITNLPDLHDFIDVKGCARNWHSLIVQKDDPDEWAYLQILGENHPWYEIVGWLWGREAKQEQNWKDPVGGRAAYFVKQADLRDPEELLAILRERQKEAA